MAKVVFYTRAGCHLCEDAFLVVERVRAKVPFELSIVDLDADAAARNRYWDKIPVIEIDGRMHAKYRLDEAAFTRRVGGSSESP